MQARAEGTTVFELLGSDKRPAELVAEPAVRYVDRFHSIVEGTLWIYGTQGRPVAVQKLERYRRPDFPTTCLYGLFSLSDNLIEAQWPGEPSWTSTKPGIERRPPTPQESGAYHHGLRRISWGELQVLPAGPEPAATDAGRLAQLKEVIRRFSVTRTDMGDIREEMLLLPGPIHRYRDPDSGLQDGALFAFAAYGTNPDLLIAIELQRCGSGHCDVELRVLPDDGEPTQRASGWPGGMERRYGQFPESTEAVESMIAGSTSSPASRGTRQTGTVTVPAIGELVGTVDTGPVPLVVRRDADAGRASTTHPLTEGPQMQPPPANFEQPKLDVTAGRLALVQAEKRLEVSKQELAPMEQLLKTGRILKSEVAERRAAVEFNTVALERAKQEYEARTKLLELDLLEADVELKAAEQRLGAADPKDPRRQQGMLELQKAKLRLDRVKILLDLQKAELPERISDSMGGF